MQAVVLAAGGGTRLGELGRRRSKPMQPVLGVPIIGCLLADLAVLDLQDVIVVTTPGDRELQDFLNHTPIAGLDIQQVVQAEPQGMADALEWAGGQIREDFLLTACDNRVPRIELQRMLAKWREHPELDGLLGLLEIPAELVGQSGIVGLNGSEIKQIVEKPAPERAPSSIASIPYYCLRPDFLSYLPEVEPSRRGERELQDALQRLIDQQALVEGWFFSQRLSLSRPDDLLEVNLDALQRHLPALDVLSEQIKVGVQFFPPVRVDEGVEIGTGSLVGPNVYLEAGAHVGRQTRLSNCVVLRQGIVPDGHTVHGRVIA